MRQGSRAAGTRMGAWIGAALARRTQPAQWLRMVGDVQDLLFSPLPLRSQIPEAERRGVRGAGGNSVVRPKKWTDGLNNVNCSPKERSDGSPTTIQFGIQVQVGVGRLERPAHGRGGLSRIPTQG